MYVTLCFWVEKKFPVTFAIFAKFEAFSRPFLVCFFSKSKILLNLYSVFLGSKKNPFTFAPLILRDFRGPFCPFVFLSLDFFKIVYSCNSCDIYKWLSHKIFWWIISFAKIAKRIRSQFLFTRSFLDIYVSQLVWNCTYSIGTKLSYLL